MLNNKDISILIVDDSDITRETLKQVEEGFIPQQRGGKRTFPPQVKPSNALQTQIKSVVN